MNAADLIIGILQKEGVEYLPGGYARAEQGVARKLPAGI